MMIATLDWRRKIFTSSLQCFFRLAYHHCHHLPFLFPIRSTSSSLSPRQVPCCHCHCLHLGLIVSAGTLNYQGDKPWSTSRLIIHCLGVSVLPVLWIIKETNLGAPCVSLFIVLESVFCRCFGLSRRQTLEHLAFRFISSGVSVHHVYQCLVFIFCLDFYLCLCLRLCLGCVIVFISALIISYWYFVKEVKPWSTSCFALPSSSPHLSVPGGGRKMFVTLELWMSMG